MSIRVTIGYLVGWGAIGLVHPLSGFAQITLDGTLGTVITGDRIDGGTQQGSTLFHSFQNFNIPINQRIDFANPTGITTIITRVTGNTASQINGTLGVLGTANFVFLNPNGLIFGPTAQLDVQGSFLGTTASRIRFDNGSVFDITTATAPPLLTVSVPVGLGFGSQPGAIAVNGPGHGLTIQPGKLAPLTHPALQVKPGHTLALVGSGVSLVGGNLLAPEGRIELGSIGPDSEVTIQAQPIGWHLGYDQVTQFRDITATNQSYLNTVGTASGSMGIAGRQIHWDNQSFLRSETIGSGTGGLVTITGETVVLDRGAHFGFEGYAAGNSGSLQLIADHLWLKGNSRIYQDMSGSGTGGNFTLNVDQILIEENSSLSNNTFGGKGGNAGNITITSDAVILRDQGVLNSSSFSSGDAGTVTIRTGSFRAEGQPQTDTGLGGMSIFGGRAGNFDIEATREIQFRNNAGIGSLVVGGKSPERSTIRLKADTILVEDAGFTTQAYLTGAAGNINLEARTITFHNRAGLDSNTGTDQSGGQITIKAANLNLIGGPQGYSELRAKSSGTGDAGTIDLQVGKLTLNDGQLQLQSEAEKQGGRAGNLRVVADTVDLSRQSLILGSSVSGPGGSLSFEVKQGMTLRGNSAIATEAGTQGGQGGHLQIRATDLTLADGSFLSSSSLGSGQGGAINITGDRLTITGVGTPIVKDASQSRKIVSGRMSTGEVFDDGTNRLYPVQSTLASGIFSQALASGQSGNLTIRAAQQMTIANGAVVSTNTTAQGQAGQIDLKVGQLQMRDRAQLTSSTSSTSSGNAGVITVEGDDIQLFNSIVTTNTFGSGHAGRVQIRSYDLSLQNQSFITSNTVSPSGSAGQIDITVGSLKLIDSQISSNTEQNTSGQGGEIHLTSQDINLQNSLISTKSNGLGNSGAITLVAHDRLISHSSTIAASALQAGGGQIYLRSRLLNLTGSSAVTTSVYNGNGGGGNITIAGDRLIALQDSDVLANAKFGTGGTIAIQTPIFIADIYAPVKGGDPSEYRGNNRVDISASSEFGVNGQVSTPTIQSLQTGITDLPSGFVDADRILVGSCLVRRNSTQGRFVITGNGALPESPSDEFRVIPYEAASSQATPSAIAPSTPTTHPLQEATQLVRTAAGRVFLVADSEVRSPSEDVCTSN